jgi:hypothetical protein
MENKKVFVLIHTTPDYVDVGVYEKKKDAMEALKELADDRGMDLYTDSAEGNENYARIEEKGVYGT